jgi:hypothetical protein
VSPAKELAREFGEVVSDLVFAPGGALATLLRVHLGDGRIITFGARDLATGAAITDGIVRPALAAALQRDLRAGLAAPQPLTVEELRSATLGYFAERCATITRENIRSVLPNRLPDDQAVTRIDRVPVPGTTVNPSAGAEGGHR